MDMSKLTQKSQEALQQAQSEAVRRGHTETDGEHLLLALLDQPEGIIPRLLEQAGADVSGLRAAIAAELDAPAQGDRSRGHSGSGLCHPATRRPAGHRRA